MIEGSEIEILFRDVERGGNVVTDLGEPPELVESEGLLAHAFLLRQPAGKVAVHAILKCFQDGGGVALALQGVAHESYQVGQHIFGACRAHAGCIELRVCLPQSALGQADIGLNLVSKLFDLVE